MNREILFRGFHECENGETIIYVNGKAVQGQWVEGAYSPFDWDILGKREEKAQIITITEDDNDGCWIECIPSTIGQCTGIKDKNGKRIFDGDIFRTDYPKCNAIVKWEGCRFLGFVIGGERRIVYVDKEPAVEVIGTIFSN